MSEQKSLAADVQSHDLISTLHNELATDLTMTKSMVSFVKRSYEIVTVLKKNRPYLDPSDPRAAQALSVWNQLDNKIGIVHRCGQALLASEAILASKIQALLAHFDMLVRSFEKDKPIKAELIHLKKLLVDLGTLSIGVDPVLTEALNNVSDVVIVGGSNQSANVVKQAIREVGELKLKITQNMEKLASFLGKIAHLENQLQWKVNTFNLENDLKLCEGDIQTSKDKISRLAQQREDGKADDMSAVDARALKQREELKKRFIQLEDEQNQSAAKSRRELEVDRNAAVGRLQNVPADTTTETTSRGWFGRKKKTYSHISYANQRNQISAQISSYDNLIKAVDSSNEERLLALQRRRDEEFARIDREKKQDMELITQGKERMLKRIKEMEMDEHKNLSDLENKKSTIMEKLKTDTANRSKWEQELKEAQELKTATQNELEIQVKQLAVMEQDVETQSEHLRNSVNSVLGYKTKGDDAVNQVMTISNAAVELSSAERSRNTSLEKASASLTQFATQVQFHVDQALECVEDVKDLDGEGLFKLLTKNAGDKVSPLFAQDMLDEGIDGEMFMTVLTKEDFESYLNKEEIVPRVRKIQLARLLRLQNVDVREKREQVEIYLKNIDEMLGVFRRNATEEEDEDDLAQI
eukprot:TRINITY_DN3786_c0_g1_i2.p1 TRINITY_DN3786_c0_g1~~TRINITY_DN3786_c0_g1_i2.p1  ORF type:complete len:666 (+),score=197.01 TRINITY_DN3786_c0_g1_i2:77-1999(+)